MSDKIQTQIDYTSSADLGMQTAFNLHASAAQPSMDRARGGIVTVTLIILPQVLPVVGAPGAVNLPQMECTFSIDMEQLPLVDVANYSVSHRQILPAVIPYPLALPNGVAPLTHVFLSL